ncbi:RNA polymerase sigma-70 factor, ECF subfamily [Chitinophaga jiangningensis]|uniref:RNA polymerase sigma-70 factor, ECF subfamily n=1 Tax=Chitinophaga jiangningensis TaxID=1419482 RepID=A0A1M7N1V5_9BACT|nr:sigma-70 family RNA polymerase sigma factor [Chitinophaga jiangningensis]SHM97527.1 RNA polymerase sigma-70 factor, ECF subfamily [Chitinophaga jiangningensis]
MPVANTAEEQALLLQIADGDAAAFTAIFHRYSKQVFDAAMVYLKDANLATETVQEIFLKVWLRRSGLTEVDNFRDYLFILTRNHIYDGFRRQLVKLKVYDIHQQQQPTMQADADHLLLEKEYDGILRAAVSALPTERRKVYQARQAGFSNEEISRQLNISVHTVKKQMSLAMQSIRTFVSARVKNDVLPILLILITFRR